MNTGNLKVFTKRTFVKDWRRFVLQYLKITMHQRDPGIVIVNDLPKLEIWSQRELHGILTALVFLQSCYETSTSFI